MFLTHDYYSLLAVAIREKEYNLCQDVGQQDMYNLSE